MTKVVMNGETKYFANSDDAIAYVKQFKLKMICPVWSIEELEAGE